MLQMPQAQQIKQKAYARSSKYFRQKQDAFGRHVLDHDNRGDGFVEKAMLEGYDKFGDAPRKRMGQKLAELQRPTTVKGHALKTADGVRAMVFGGPRKAPQGPQGPQGAQGPKAD